MTFIVAEVSANHLGSKERMIALIAAASAAGADSVKFQCWSKEHMVLDRTWKVKDGPWAGRALAELYAEAHTPWEWVPDMMAAGKTFGIEVFASVFDPESLAVLEDAGCPRYKIASFELTDTPLIKAVDRTQKPMIVSTGMASAFEIWDALGECHDPDKLTLLHCSSAYPAPPGSLNLKAMATMVKTFCVPVGFSDHTLGSEAAIAAVTLGATVIEKHLTLARSDGGPDAGFSAEPAEFAAMVKSCRLAAQMQGSGVIGCNADEEAHRALRRSLFFCRDMEAGQPITESVVRTARPALGLSPDRMQDVTRRKTARAVRCGEPVTFELLA